MKKPSLHTVLLLLLLALLLLLILLLLFFLLHSGSHAAQLGIFEDICIADLNSDIKINGFTCKASAAINISDFSSMVLSTPGATNNLTGTLVTPLNVELMQGLNTLGISMSRIDFSPGGLNPPHVHPRATEMVFVLDGKLDVGFITSTNKLITKTVSKGEVFVFPRGLIHYQANNGDGDAAVIAVFDSQLPGTQSVAATLFAASPTVDDGVLAETFGIGNGEVEDVKARLKPKN